MGLIISLICLPFKIFRDTIVNPIHDQLNETYEDYKFRTKEGVITARELIFKLAVVALAAAVIIWLAIFLYIAFYYTYMPSIAHIRPVHMQFKTDESLDGPTTFPQAHVLLTKKQQLLMVGQPYRVSVNIDMPESEQNLELGMFMVCAEMRDQTTKLLNHACRSAMLHYRSKLARTITTLVLSPLIVLGVKEETQHIPVELFTSYEDDLTNPVTDVFVEIQTKKIQFYSVKLHITANFTGLRYIMFHWPILSASIGVGGNLFFILTVSLLSWYHWSESVLIEEARQKIRSRAEESRKRREKFSEATTPDVSSISSSNDEYVRSFGEEDDDEDISIINEKSMSKLSDVDEIEELSDVGDLPRRKQPHEVGVVDVSIATSEIGESKC